ncbi:MAG: rRNA maturation RNase YbeY [Magnetovibrio sp.]|nr:rRNA maturation RNase YbeY [Magnetovibrio sp.]|tara:strand:+ start:2733 stop:3302 length:570 start_codon:yes stop_codon:yes gene_type:complete
MMTRLEIKNSAVDISVEVNVRDSGWNLKLINVKKLCRKAATAAWHAAEILDTLDSTNNTAEVSISLIGDDEITELNKNYRARDRPTNVLSFPALDFWTDRKPPPGAPLLLGDVVIALGITECEAREQEKSLANHLSHLVVHGTLHLFGYNHVKREDTKIMENLEKTVLASLAIPDPYSETQVIKAKLSE